MRWASVHPPHTPPECLGLLDSCHSLPPRVRLPSVWEPGLLGSTLHIPLPSPGLYFWGLIPNQATPLPHGSLAPALEMARQADTIPLIMCIGKPRCRSWKEPTSDPHQPVRNGDRREPPFSGPGQGCVPSR